MALALVVAGLAWWFALAYLAVRRGLRGGVPAPPVARLAAAPAPALLAACAAACALTLGLGLGALGRIASLRADFGPLLFGAIVSAAFAGAALAALRSRA